MKKREEKANRVIVNLEEISDLHHELRQDATKTMTYFKQIELYHQKIQQLNIKQIKRIELIIDKMEIIKNNRGREESE